MNTRWDVDFSFEVGSAERHTVSFHWRQAPGKATIDVDGVQVLNKSYGGGFALRLRRRYEIDVGDREHHSVVIEKRRPLLWAGFREQSFQVLVDGALVSGYEAGMSS